MLGMVSLDGVEYMTPDQRAITRSSANQMAAKLGSGAGTYDDQINWESLLWDNWQGGIGKKEPDAGGSLIASLDTRFEGQIALPSITRNQSKANLVTPQNAYQSSRNYDDILGTITDTYNYTTVTVGADETYTKLANTFRWDETDTYELDAYEVLLPGKSDTCTQVYVELWTCNNDSIDATTGDHPPETLVASDLITLRDEPGLYWYATSGLSTTYDAFGGNLWYALVVYPADGSLDIPTIDTVYDNHWYYYTGAAEEPTEGWTQGDGIPSFMSRYDASGGSAIPTVAARFGDYIYIGDSTGVDIFEPGVGVVDRIVTNEPVTDLLPLDGRLYIGLGDTDSYQYEDTPGAGTAGTAAVPARLWLLHNGLLYRAVGANVYYTDDEVTWVTVEVGLTDREAITGMAGLNGDVFISTNRALYRVGEDGVSGLLVTKWGAPSVLNGIHMFTFQGNVYISLGQSVLRFDGENFLPYGPDLGEGLPTQYAGLITGFAANNNWLLCAVTPSSDSSPELTTITGAASIWAHNGQGWHHITELPTGRTMSCFCYSHEENGFANFFSATFDRYYYMTLIADTQKAQRLAAAIEATDYHYHHFGGWIEQNWFYGGLREVEKDWESVYLDGVNIDTNQYVEVYWMGELDTEWNLLGTITSPTDELRWDDPDTRPSGRRIRIGLALYNSFSPGTPVVTAIRVKYQPMIIDRWRWSVPIEVKNRQEMLDHTMNERNASQMATHLDGLTRQVAPFIYRDTDLNEYEVKILNAVRGEDKLEVSTSGTVSFQAVYNLTLEQVTAETYSEA